MGEGLEGAHLCREGRGLFGGAEEFGGVLALGVFYLLVVEEADGGAAPYEPGPVVLHVAPCQPISTFSPRDRSALIYLASRDGVLEQGQVGESREAP